MLHVAVIGLRGIPNVMGGIETHSAHLLPRLVAQAPQGQIKVTVLARRGYVDHPSRHDGVDQIPIWAPRHRIFETIVHSFLAVFYARFVLSANCVHLHGIGPGLTSPIVRLLGLYLVFTHHGEDYRRQKWSGLSKLALRLGEVLSVTFSHRIISVSKSTAERLRSRHPGKADRIVHIPNGLSPPGAGVDPPGVPETLHLTPGNFLITVGRLVPEKAQDLLIEAYRRTSLAGRTPPCKLVIVGDADHQSAYADRILESVGDGVVLAGRLPLDLVMALNREAALFVLPSYHEGLSIAALEAIFAGAPILLSDIRANRDIGLPAHHYFTSGSVDDLSEKLERDFDSYKVTEDFDVDAFNWDRIAEATLKQFAALRYRGRPLLGGDHAVAKSRGFR